MPALGFLLVKVVVIELGLLVVSDASVLTLYLPLSFRLSAVDLP